MTRTQKILVSLALATLSLFALSAGAAFARNVYVDESGRQISLPNDKTKGDCVEVKCPSGFGKDIKCWKCQARGNGRLTGPPPIDPSVRACVGKHARDPGCPEYPG